MLAFALNRFFQGIGVMLVVGLIAFTLFRYVGDPINQLVGLETSVQQRADLREQLGLNDSVPVQFARFAARAATLDFGTSYQYKEPVADLIASRMPATLELALVSAIVALGFGVIFGVVACLYRRAAAVQILMAISLVGISLPTFLVGILMIYVFSVMLGWLPSFGRGQTITVFGSWTTGLLSRSGWSSLILPAVTLGLFQMTLVMRLVRSEMLEVLRSDYIRFARARGLSSRVINFRHALKNTLVPVITITGLQIGSIIAFSIVTETVFQWPGMGLLFLQAVQNVDIPVMAAYLILIAFLFTVINFVVDMLYFAVDPRIRVEGRPA